MPQPFIFRTIDLDGQTIRTAVRPGKSHLTPLLIFNGIGANLELVFPFVQAGKAIGAAGCRRSADTGYVEGNHFQVRVQRLDERKHQLKVGADAIEDQQRRQVRLARAHRRADGLAIQVDGAEDER